MRNVTATAPKAFINKYDIGSIGGMRSATMPPKSRIFYKFFFSFVRKYVPMTRI